MVKKGNRCCIAHDALDILPINSKLDEQWKVASVWGDCVTIQRILSNNKLEELFYEVTEKMLILIE